uniref:Uncharacterized protein n=1 Tax=Arundo donax TaxID=35708 RepID=A0A0A9B4C7_ARUDO
MYKAYVLCAIVKFFCWPSTKISEYFFF